MSFDDTSKVMEEMPLQLNTLTLKKRKTDFSILILLLEQKTRFIYWIQKKVIRQKAQKPQIKVMHFKNELKKSNQNAILR